MADGAWTEGKKNTWQSASSHALRDEWRIPTCPGIAAVPATSTSSRRCGDALFSAPTRRQPLAIQWPPRAFQLSVHLLWFIGLRSIRVISYICTCCRDSGSSASSDLRPHHTLTQGRHLHPDAPCTPIAPAGVPPSLPVHLSSLIVTSADLLLAELVIARREPEPANFSSRPPVPLTSLNAHRIFCKLPGPSAS